MISSSTLTWRMFSQKAVPIWLPALRKQSAQLSSSTQTTPTLADYKYLSALFRVWYAELLTRYVDNFSTHGYISKKYIVNRKRRSKSQTITRVRRPTRACYIIKTRVAPAKQKHRAWNCFSKASSWFQLYLAFSLLHSLGSTRRSGHAVYAEL